MQTRTILFILLVSLFIATACQKKPEKLTASESVTACDSVMGTVVADTIIYDVIIRNQNPDDTWAAECLQGLNHAALINNIFSMVYEEKATAYNHETNEKLTNKQLQAIEKEDGFNRDNISMIQFTEAWFINTGETSMIKKVLSMVLGYDYYSSEGEIIGHKPVFRIIMNGRQ